ncbi:MAG: hypothetical protein V4685_17990, partial [Bacteroidota bacterium]
MNNIIFNITALKKYIPSKPKNFTSDIPYTIEESLTKYINQSTISNIRAASYTYDLYGWSIPLYVDPTNIQIGFYHKVVLAKTGGLYGRFKYWDIFNELQIKSFEPLAIKKNLFF